MDIVRIYDTHAGADLVPVSVRRRLNECERLGAMVKKKKKLLYIVFL